MSLLQIAEQIVQSALFTITVLGTAKPGGSKTVIVARRKDGAIKFDPKTGRPTLFYTDASGKKGADWRKAVAQAGRVMGPRKPLDCPLAIYAEFRIARPAGHYGTGRNAGVLRAQAPAYPTGKPDATKLWRSAEDALTGICWTDDSRIVQQVIAKRYVNPADAGMALWVSAMPL